MATAYSAPATTSGKVTSERRRYATRPEVGAECLCLAGVAYLRPRCAFFFAISLGTACLLITTTPTTLNDGHRRHLTSRKVAVAFSTNYSVGTVSTSGATAVTADDDSAAELGCHCALTCPSRPDAWAPDKTLQRLLQLSKKQQRSRAYLGPHSDRGELATASSATSPHETVVFNESVHRRAYEFDCPLRDRCSGGGVGLLAVVVVPSAPGNVDRRNAIRSTWASEARACSINVVFLVGLSSDAAVRRALDDESRRTGDLILANFADSYDLLTVKSVAMLRWASTRCRSARYLVKVDDDMFVSLPHLSRVLNASAGIARVVIGHRRDHLHVISGAKHKWRNPFYLRHYGDTYPTYMSGTTYALGMTIVPELFAATQAELFDRMEDVFVTGICARRIGNVTHLMHAGFRPRTRQSCDFTNQAVVTAHHVTPLRMKVMWRTLQIKDACSPTGKASVASSASKPAVYQFESVVTQRVNSTAVPKLSVLSSATRLPTEPVASSVAG